MSESKYYISCTGKLCITVRDVGRPPLLFKVVGVHQWMNDGTLHWTHKQIY